MHFVIVVFCSLLVFTGVSARMQQQGGSEIVKSPDSSSSASFGRFWLPLGLGHVLPQIWCPTADIHASLR